MTLYGSNTCVESWECSVWSQCTGSPPEGLQSRECVDYNNCGSTVFKPVTTRTCTISGTPTGGGTRRKTVEIGTNETIIVVSEEKILKTEVFEFDLNIYKVIVSYYAYPNESIDLRIFQVNEPAERTDTIPFEFFTIYASMPVEKASYNFRANMSWIMEHNINKTSLSLEYFTNAWRELNSFPLISDTNYAGRTRFPMLE